MISRLAAAAALSAAALAASALPAQIVGGHVVDRDSGRPIPGMLVALLPADTSGASLPVRLSIRGLGMAHTDGDGWFTLAAPDTGTYRVRFGFALLSPAVIHLAQRDSTDAHEYRLIADSLGPCVLPRLTATLDSVQAAGGVLCGHEVTGRAAMVPGNVKLLYPYALYDERLSGSVAARFVVDSAGRAEPGSFAWTRTADTRRDFVSAAEDGVRAARFRPAERGGRPVRQSVWLSITFHFRGVEPPPPLPAPDGEILDSIVVTTGFATRSVRSGEPSSLARPQRP